MTDVKDCSFFPFSLVHVKRLAAQIIQILDREIWTKKEVKSRRAPSAISHFFKLFDGKLVGQPPDGRSLGLLSISSLPSMRTFAPQTSRPELRLFKRPV